MRDVYRVPCVLYRVMGALLCLVLHRVIGALLLLVPASICTFHFQHACVVLR